MIMFDTFDRAIARYYWNIAKITEDFKQGRYKDAKGYKVALGEEYGKIYNLLFELARYTAITWNEYDELTDDCYDYAVKTFTKTIS